MAGEPAKKADAPSYGWGNWIAAFVVFFVVLGSCNYFGSKSSDDDEPRRPRGPGDWNNEADDNMAYIVLQNHVKRELASPSTAKFPLKPTGFRRDGPVYDVHSYVDSENAFGAEQRTVFFGQVMKNGPDDWIVGEVEFAK